MDEEDADLEVMTSDIDASKLRRGPRVAATTPCERRELDPGSYCPDCGGDLRRVGEDMSEMLDLVTAQLKFLQIARLKKSCRRCERMVQTPAPSRPIPGSMASAALLAWILFSKFDIHLPLYRLNDIFARMGADVPDSTLDDWCGRAMKVLVPLVERIEANVMASDLLHADDTPIRVLDRSQKDRGLGKGVKQGRIWAYVRDPRPWVRTAPPGAVYRGAPDWKQEHVQSHLAQTRGILQADGYKGYARLCESGPDGTPRLQEASCWAHLRRDVHDSWDKTKSAIAREALYDIEREINGLAAETRLAARQKHSAPKVAVFFDWSESHLTRIPGKGDLARALRYGLARRASFSLFLTDGRVAIDNNPAEHTLRPIGVGWSLCTPFVSAWKH
jgi:transposase